MTKFIKTNEDKRVFIGAILNPPEPNDRLKKAAVNYKTKKLNS